MARNGSGTYVLPAGNPVTTGTTISSTWANTTLSDIGSALTGSISTDGQTTPTANLPMGGFAHTGVANASVRTQYASAGQVQDGALEYLGSVSGTDTITASAAVGMSAYTVGQAFRFVSAGANTTTAVTININGIGAKNITKNGATALAIGDIPSGAAIEIIYDGTQFQAVGLSINLAGYAPLNSPTFTGAPAAPTATAGTNTTQLASTAFVTAAVAAGGSFPSGTRMSFQQTAAPTGWTKDTTAAINDSILRFVTGTASSGGSTAFSTFNAQTATAAYTLATADIPSHNHTIPIQGSGSGPFFTQSTGNGSTVLGGTSFSSAITATGGGGSHSHGLTTSIKYYDFIIASKN